MPHHTGTFPADFTWGVATAAPQIEGAAFADGKGESIWDRFARQPGKVHGGDTLDVACDHYHRYREDFALMRELGIKHYRLSIAWPRIYPHGDGAVNRAGVDFYHRLFDALAECGITPWVTMFHWDLPQALEDRGGWCDRGTVDAFARYADTIVREYGSKVKHWITLNEIRCFTWMGYAPEALNKAPGRPVSRALLNQTYHHALLCHGHGVRAVREHGGAGARVGLTDNTDIGVPVEETAADIAATKAFFIERNEHLLGAIYAGGYAERYLRKCGADAPQVAAGDFGLISTPTDFLGMNIYTGAFVRAGRDGNPELMGWPKSYPMTDGWWLRIIPQSIYWGPRLAHEVYGVKDVYITENGAGYDHEPVVNGEVNDVHRRDYVRSYLREVERAVGDGVPVRGYFLWALIDNFEWEDGYQRRFGIVHTDFATQVRTPKLSARYYAAVLREKRIV